MDRIVGENQTQANHLVHIARRLLGRILLAFSALAPFTPALADDRPNIVVILCDDLGFSDLGCYGGEIETPNLDQLAARGLRFTDFHNNAKCTQTRASLLTGLWHQQSKNLKLPENATLAEVLQDAGYSTYMVGKWHLAGHPMDRGFEQYFGFLSGCINFFTGEDWGTGKNLMRDGRSVYVTPDGFYSTDAFTDRAIDYLQDRPQDRPFFLYLAHNAPHFPLHALPEDIQKYQGKYAGGWDVIRQQRYDRMTTLGLIDKTWRLSDRDPKVEPWSEITASQAAFLEPMMNVYAAMVDRLDQNIGRLVHYLRQTDQLDNTLILFLSDNGACPYQRLRTEIRVPGPRESEIAYDARWANMCNTPLRLYKQYAHGGGTTTPMIAHWPKGIAARGEITRATGHIVDIMPTVVELAEAHYPQVRGQHRVLPMEGSSLVSAFRGADSARARPIYWEFASNHAVRDGDWKLVAERSREWELYDLANDRCETKNLVDEHPEQVQRLAKIYDTWARRVGAKSHAKCVQTAASQQSQLFDLD